MTSTGLIGAAITLSPLAQLPFSEQAWQVAAQSGFNAVLVLILLGLQWNERKEARLRDERKEVAINHLTMAVTQVTLGMTFAPPAFHEQAKELQRQVQQRPEA